MPIDYKLVTNFTVGIFVGANTARHEMKNGLDMRELSIILLAAYAALRTPGGFNNKLNNVLAMAVGMTIGVYACRVLFPLGSAASQSPKLN